MSELRRKTITGYCDPISARPGQALDFKVCCYQDGGYEADLVRVIGGDDTPGGIGVIEEAVAAPFAGSHGGRFQAIHTGSYGIVDDLGDLAGLQSFTLQAMIQPTLPGQQRQVVMGRWRSGEEAGFALLLDEDGALALAIGEDGGRQAFLTTGVPMRRGQWAFAAASYDGASGRARLVQRPLPMGPGDSLISPAVRSMSSQRRVTISFFRHPVSTRSRIAAMPEGRNLPPVSASSSTRPSRLYSSGLRKRSRRFCL